MITSKFTYRGPEGRINGCRARRIGLSGSREGPRNQTASVESSSVASSPSSSSSPTTRQLRGSYGVVVVIVLLLLLLLLRLVLLLLLLSTPPWSTPPSTLGATLSSTQPSTPSDGPLSFFEPLGSWHHSSKRGRALSLKAATNHLCSITCNKK